MWRCEYSPRALFTTFHFFIAYEWTNSTLVCTGLPRGKRSSLVGTFISYEKLKCFEDDPWNWVLSRDVLNIFLIASQPNLEKLISSKKSLKLFFSSFCISVLSDSICVPYGISSKTFCSNDICSKNVSLYVLLY